MKKPFFFPVTTSPRQLSSFTNLLGIIHQPKEKNSPRAVSPRKLPVVVEATTNNIHYFLKEAQIFLSDP